MQTSHKAYISAHRETSARFDHSLSPVHNAIASNDHFLGDSDDDRQDNRQSAVFGTMGH